jgi:CDP-glycerol glycerophosphotransferase
VDFGRRSAKRLRRAAVRYRDTVLRLAPQQVDPKLIAYVSFHGRYADSPRVIFEQLNTRLPDYRHVWIVRPGASPELPPNATVVKFGSIAHFRALATARMVITNDHLPRWWRKRRGAFYLQTWHGTPFKRIAFGIRKLDAFPPDFLSRVRADVRKWDCLLSPSPEVTEIFREAFQFEGWIAETGLPRNDALHAPDADAQVAAMKEHLALPPDKRVVLYAPTLRDELVTSGRPFRPPFDWSRFGRELGDECVLVLRLHPNMRAWDSDAHSDFVIDLSSHSDIEDLLLVADVLVTDYSSTAFDFAPTGKGVIFFMPDRERYERDERGFYIDPDSGVLPGPIVTDEDDLFERLADPSTSVPAANLSAFVATFAPRDDGSAAERVISEVIEPELRRGCSRHQVGRPIHPNAASG